MPRKRAAPAEETGETSTPTPDEDEEQDEEDDQDDNDDYLEDGPRTKSWGSQTVMLAAVDEDGIRAVTLRNATYGTHPNEELLETWTREKDVRALMDLGPIHQLGHSLDPSTQENSTGNSGEKTRKKRGSPPHRT